MKINSEDYYYDILTKLFGDDLTDKLMSSEVSDDLLDAVQNSIKEIEELKKKDDLKSQNQVQNNKFHQANADEIEDQPKRFPIEQISNPNIKQNINRNNSNKKLNNEKNNYQEKLKARIIMVKIIKKTAIKIVVLKKKNLLLVLQVLMEIILIPHYKKVDLVN